MSGVASLRAADCDRKPGETQEAQDAPQTGGGWQAYPWHRYVLCRPDAAWRSVSLKRRQPAATGGNDNDQVDR